MANDILPPARQPPRAMQIKNLVPSLPERGKLKIGVKGREITSRQGNKFQPPEKLDHFVVTTLDRDQAGNFRRDERAHARLGDKPTEIPVRLLYDDPALNFPTRYAAYKGRMLWCCGDGEEAYRVVAAPQAGQPTHETVKCPCHRQNPEYSGPDKCKMNGSLSVLLEGAGGLGGVWKFRTTSYNSIVGLMSSMSFIRSITGGPLAGIPFKLFVQPKQVTSPVDGRQQTIYVVGLTFDGDVTTLQQLGHGIALDRAKTHMSIAHIEDEARRMLALPPPPNAPLPGDDAADVVEEFYPEQIDGGSAPPRPTRDGVTAMPERAAVADADLAEGEPGGETTYVDVVLDVLNETPPPTAPVDDDAPREIPFDGDWVAWGTLIAARLKAASDRHALEGWVARNAHHLAACDKAAPKIASRLDAIIQKRRDEMAIMPELVSTGEPNTVLGAG